MPFRTIEVSDPSFECQGLRHVTVKSAALRRRADMTLWIPENRSAVMPLVILMHGVYGSHWAWAWKGGAHRTAAALMASGAIPPMVLAMPSDGLWGDGSGYIRHGSGEDYEQWIIEEVPAAAAEITQGLTNNGPLFLSGLSMGGYGALRLGAKHGTRVAAVSAHSSATDFHDLDAITDEDMGLCGVELSECAIIDLLRANRNHLPPIRFDCGVSDVLLPQNRALHAAMEAEKISHTYEEFPGGHDWPYWQEHVADSFRFFGGICRA
jgi:enterochelin esterase-like enzyme